MARPAVLMTDPRHFAIKGGANPHTRRADNSMKTVDLEAAWPQWHGYVDALLEGGVDVYVAQAAPELTGMVFAANAGFLEGRLDDRPSSEKTFYPSHFHAAHRVAEGEHFRRFCRKFGFRTADYESGWDFEGEADAFPVGRGEEREWIFTWGYRTDREVADWLEEEVIGEPMHRLKLTDPRYYHGDTLVCELGGPVMAWKGGLEARAQQRLDEVFGDRLLELEDRDAADFIGNSFYVETQSDRLLYTPAAIRESTRAKIEERGVEVVPVDISEFFGKGGGGPKCMVFNLGEVDPDEAEAAPKHRQFRRERHVETLREREDFPG